MKKVMVSLLVVALVIGCFAGCGKKEKGDLQQQAVMCISRRLFPIMEVVQHPAD